MESSLDDVNHTHVTWMDEKLLSLSTGKVFLYIIQILTSACLKGKFYSYLV